MQNLATISTSQQEYHIQSILKESYINQKFK